MKFVKIMIIASAFYLTYAHAREIHQAVDEPAAPYNLRWGMSYDEARNTPLYSLEVSDINYAWLKRPGSDYLNADSPGSGGVEY